MNQDNIRSSKYSKRALLELVLKQINNQLAEQEAILIHDFDQPKFPSLFIIGTQRSGTTLLMQMLLQYASFGYINNLIAKFWEAPYMGTVFAQSFLEKDSTGPASLSSDLGYTKGYEGPHEFSYFWRKWFPEATFEGQTIEDKTMLIKTIAALESEWEAPMLFKNIVTCSMIIPQLSKLFPKSVFLYIKRDDFFTAQSTYFSRLKLYNDPMAWFGLKPPEYEKISKFKTPWEQIAAQLFFSKRNIESSLLKIPDSRKVFINYESLVKKPNESLQKVFDIFKFNNYNLKLKSHKFTNLSLNNQIKLDNNQEKLLSKALQKYNF